MDPQASVRFFGSQRVVTRERAGTDTGVGLGSGLMTRERSGTDTGVEGGSGVENGSGSGVEMTRERSATDSGAEAKKVTAQTQDRE